MTDLARTPKQLGATIQRARKQRGWTQAFVAERAGLRQETISIIENGAKASKLSSILAVLGALDLELRVAERSKWQPQDIDALF